MFGYVGIGSRLPWGRRAGSPMVDRRWATRQYRREGWGEKVAGDRGSISTPGSQTDSPPRASHSGNLFSRSPTPTRLGYLDQRKRLREERKEEEEVSLFNNHFSRLFDRGSWIK